MKRTIVLGIGAGRCGLRSLAKMLGAQPCVSASCESPPLLPWQQAAEQDVLTERFARLRRHAEGSIVSDVASFYLPYLDLALGIEQDLRVVCLRRPREEVIASFCRLLDRSGPLRMNHWAKKPPAGEHHDPLRTPTYPQYDVDSREEGIGRYWDEYYQRVETLASLHPESVRMFEMSEVLNNGNALSGLLDFAGIPKDQQVAVAGIRADDSPAPRKRQTARRSSSAMDPSRCVILVPYGATIMPRCERALDALERRGYDVRRAGGYAAIDQARNQLGTDALLDGYEETMWIDSDVDFDPGSVDQLRSHGLPIVCGMYPQKGNRALAGHIMPGTSQMIFGKKGGLVEIMYAAAGFLLVRREVYLTIQRECGLPMCNQRFGSPMMPFFSPFVHPIEDGHWYLAEDFAFSQRARSCGYKIMADTTIRLWHIGHHSYGWEDAGMDRPRFRSFTMGFPSSSEVEAAESREHGNDGEMEKSRP
jgi:hypothetical protein